MTPTGVCEPEGRTYWIRPCRKELDLLRPKAPLGGPDGGILTPLTI